MVTLFHESQTDKTVSVEESDGKYVLKIDPGKPEDPELPSVSRDDLAILKSPVYVLDSVKAGKGTSSPAGGIYSSVIKPIFSELLGITANYVQTTSAESITEFAATLKASSGRVIVIILGGDTSISEFVNGLSLNPNSGFVDLAVVPTGTGNALALSLGFTDPPSAIKKLVLATEFEFRPLHAYSASLPKGSKKVFRGDDVADAPDKYYFLVVFSWAFHASLVADSDTEELRQHGNERFKIAAQKNLQSAQKYSGSYSVGSAETKGPFSYFVVTPVSNFEPGFRISPGGDVHDSTLYIVSVGYEHEEQPTGKYLYDIMLEAYDQGKHVSNPKVAYEKVEEESSITLEVNDKTPANSRRFCVDGAIIRLPNEGSSSISIKHEGNRVREWTVRLLG